MIQGPLKRRRKTDEDPEDGKEHYEILSSEHDMTVHSGGDLNRIYTKSRQLNPCTDGCAPQLPPFKKELLTVDGCCRQRAILFDGVTTDRFSMLQRLAPHPCTCEQKRRPEVWRKTYRREYRRSRRRKLGEYIGS